MLPQIFTSHESNPVLPLHIAKVRYANGATKQLIVRGAHKGAAFDQIYGESLRVHPTTREIAYVARKAKHHVIVQNHHVSALYDAMWFESLFFTPCGDALFFLAERNGKTVFVVNGVEHISYAMALDVRPRSVSDDGTAIGLDVAVLMNQKIEWLRAMPRSPLQELQTWTPYK